MVVSTLEDDEMEATEDFTLSITVISGGPVDIAVNIATVEITDNAGVFKHFMQLHYNNVMITLLHKSESGYRDYVAGKIIHSIL